MRKNMDKSKSEWIKDQERILVRIEELKNDYIRADVYSKNSINEELAALKAMYNKLDGLIRADANW